MEYLIKIDQKSIRPNAMTDAMVIYGRKIVSSTVQHNKIVGGKVYGYTENYIGSGINPDNTLVNPVMMSQEVVPYMIVAQTHTQVTQDAQTVYEVGRQPKFKFDYLPTTVRCCECEEEFPHTELQRDYNDWDYQEGCQSEFCDTICPKCRKWWCCKLVLEVPSDEELEKRMGQGLNQVVIE